MKTKTRGVIVASLLEAVLMFVSVVFLGGCDGSHLAQVNAQQLTSEEQANITLFRPFATGVANLLVFYDGRMAEAAKSQDPATIDAYVRQAHACIEQQRTAARNARYEEPKWRQIVPDSMQGIRAANRNCRLAWNRIKGGEDVSDEELVQLYRAFHEAERKFREETASRLLQPAGSSSASFFLYVSLRGAPVFYEATQGEVYLGPTIPIGPFDVNPIVGPVGNPKGGTPLQRLVIRDPETMTQRVWMLNNRMPKLSIPASYIETEGADLVITPR